MPTTPATPCFFLIVVHWEISHEQISETNLQLSFDGCFETRGYIWLEKASVNGDVQFLGNLLGAVSIWKLLKSI
jgi:hypothetical protein